MERRWHSSDSPPRSCLCSDCVGVFVSNTVLTRSTRTVRKNGCSRMMNPFLLPRLFSKFRATYATPDVHPAAAWTFLKRAFDCTVDFTHLHTSSSATLCRHGSLWAESGLESEVSDEEHLLKEVDVAATAA